MSFVLASFRLSMRNPCRLAALARYKWLCRDQRYTQHSRLTIWRSNLWSVEIFWLYFDNVLKWKISAGNNNTRPAEASGQVSRERASCTVVKLPWSLNRNPFNLLPLFGTWNANNGLVLRKGKGDEFSLPRCAERGDVTKTYWTRHFISP